MPNFRVSDQARYQGIVPNYNRLLGKQIDLQQAISSGKSLTQASQDPLATGLAQRYQLNDSRLEQNIKNIDEAKSFSEQTTTAINGAVQTLQRARELAVSSIDGSLNLEDRTAIASEVNQLLGTLVDMGTQKYGDRFIFAGTQTDTPAFLATTDAAGNITAVTYQGNGEDIAAEYTPGQTAVYNTLGSNEAGGTVGVLRDVLAGVDVFQSLIDFRNNLIANPAGLSVDLQNVSDSLDHVTTVSVLAGGTQTRFEAASRLHEDQRDLLGAALSKLQDTDIAAAATELNALQNAYQASLAVGARVGNISLLDYLR